MKKFVLFVLTFMCTLIFFVYPGNVPAVRAASAKYCVTYQMPEAEVEWRDPWFESEVNIVCIYTSKTKLKEGDVEVTICVPALTGVEREDNFEVCIHAMDDFYNWEGTNAKVTYSGGKIYVDDNSVTPGKDGYVRIPVKVPYNSSMVSGGKRLKIIAKSHCDSSAGGYPVSLSDWKVNDKSASKAEKIDLSSSDLSLKGEMYATGYPVKYTLSNSLSKFYIMNPVRKLECKKTYQLQVFNPENIRLDYHSSDNWVAEVSAGGKITACGVGSCVIYVGNKESGQRFSFLLEVGKPKVILENSEILMIAGRSAKFSARTEFAGKQGKYQWSSSKPSVAAIGKDGTVQAKKAGTTTITVKDTVNAVKTSFKLEVYKPKDPNKIGKYISLGNTSNVTTDIAKKSCDLLYSVYKNVFDYFNNGEYENVTLFFTVNDYAPAYSDSENIYLSSEYILDNSKDVDCITHELIHCAQNYREVGDCVWLMEGLTDYGRYLFGIHNKDCGWSLASYSPNQSYTDSYTVTAAFIKYVTDNYNKKMPKIINDMFKKGGYKDSIWKESTGYTIDQLWKKYADSSKK